MTFDETQSHTISEQELFLETKVSHLDEIRIDLVNIDICGDLACASVLSKIAYWFAPSKKTGQTKLSVISDGKYWLAKSDSQWWEECRVTEKQMRRIKKCLIDLGIIEIKIMKWGGDPMTHYHLNINNYYTIYKKQVQKNITFCTKGREGARQKGQEEHAERDSTITLSTTLVTNRDNVSDDVLFKNEKPKTKKTPIPKREPRYELGLNAEQKKIHDEIISYVPKTGMQVMSKDVCAWFRARKCNVEHVRQAFEVFKQDEKIAGEKGKTISNMGGAIVALIKSGRTLISKDAEFNKNHATLVAKNKNYMEVLKTYVKVKLENTLETVDYTLPKTTFITVLENLMRKVEYNK